MNQEIKLKYQLKLLEDEWGNLKKGDITTFYFNLNDERNGLARFSIDKRWEIVSSHLGTGFTDGLGDEIYCGDTIKFRRLTRLTQTHSGDNIPNGHCVEPMEMTIEDVAGEVVYEDGMYLVTMEKSSEFGTQNCNIPLTYLIDSYDEETIVDTVRVSSSNSFSLFETLKDDTEIANQEIAELIIDYGLCGIEDLITYCNYLELE